jgi:hypothetical protein
LPAVFRVGYKVRCCTWEGRPAGTGIWAREIMEHCLVLLFHLLKDKDGKNEYVRTLCVALASWQPWMEKIPAVCFVEESCEALLSRMGHRCDVYRNLHGFEATFDLFLTLPPPKRGLKSTRGSLKQGLVVEFMSRVRSIIFSGGDLCFASPGAAKDMHCVLQPAFPAEFEFPAEFPATIPVGELQFLLRRCLRCLVGKVTVKADMEALMDAKVPRRPDHEVAELQSILEDELKWFLSERRRLARQAARACAPAPPLSRSPP